jgi:protein-S-isoprenylcysteine O-methyltransferase Ste14
MYLVYLAIVVGEAILYRSLPLTLYACLFFALEHAYVVGFEEHELRGRFGAEYDVYCARVGRWLPRRDRTA